MPTDMTTALAHHPHEMNRKGRRLDLCAKCGTMKWVDRDGVCGRCK